MDDLVEMLRLPTGCVPPNRWELLAAKEIERLRAALRKIDAIAVSKKAGSLVQMQRVARQALADSNGERHGNS